MTDTAFSDILAPTFFTRDDGLKLAYRFTDGDGPLLVFLPGYMSDMEGGKALSVFSYARAHGRACLLLDYAGCGSSEGAFLDGTLPVWRDDVLALIDHVWPKGGAILPIGSSMGGWLALLVALARKERMAGLIGIAAAPDFTSWGFTEAQKAELQEKGVIYEPSDYGDDYPTSLGFWRSGEDNLLLGGEIPLSGPVRFIHGQADTVVPWEIATRTAAQLRSDDVKLLFIKDGDHRLSRDADIAALLRLIDELLERT